MAKGNGGGNAEGITVGRISIKVSPDTKAFRRELKSELEDIEKSVKGKVKVDADADTAKAEEKLDKAARNRTAKVKIEASDDRDWLKKINDRARALRDAVNPGTQNDFQRAKLHSLINEMKSMDGMSTNSLLNPDVKVLRAKWQAALNEVEGSLKKQRLDGENIPFTNIKKGSIKAPVEVDSAKAESEARTLRERLKSIFGKKIKQEVKVDKDRKLSIPSLPGGGGGGGGGGGFSIPNGFPSFGSGINPAGWAVILAGIMAVVAPLMGLITTALMALPGLLTTILTPIAAVALGMEGIGKAAEKAGLYEDKKPGKKGGGSLGWAIKDLKDQVSGEFATKLVEPFTQIGNLLQNSAFKSGFVGIADGLSKMAGGFAQAVSTGPGLESINKSIANIGKGLGQMAPGIGDFTTGIAGLVEGFTSQLPDISDWFNRSMKGFKDWVAEISKPAAGGGPSQLQTAFDQLGHTVDEVFSKIADWGRKAFDFMATPGSMNGFIETLDKIGNAITKIIDLSAKFNESWQAVVQAGRVAGGVWDFLSAGPKALGDLFNGFDTHNGADAMNGMMSNFRDLADNKPWLEGATGAGSGTQAQVDALTKSAQAAGDAAAAAKPKVDGLIGGGGTESIKGVLPGGHGAGGGPSTIAQPEAAVSLPAPDTTAAKAALEDYKTTAETTMAAAKTAIDNATANAQIQPPNFGSFATALDGLTDSANQAMRNVVGAVEQGGADAATAAQGVADGIKAPIVALVGLMSGVGMDIDRGLAAGITAGQFMPQLAAQAMAIATLQAAKAALDSHSPSKKFMQLGEDTGSGMAIGMDKGFGPVLAQAKDLAGKVSAAFSADGDPTGNLNGFTDKEVTRMGKVLGFESKRLGLQAKALDYQAKIQKNDGLKAQADAIKAKKEEIDLQKEMLSLTADYADMQNEGQSDWKGPIAKMMTAASNMPMDFMNATGDQFMSDIGISGGGLLGALKDYGQNLGSTFVFNAGNMEDALTAQQNLTNRQALGVVGR